MLFMHRQTYNEQNGDYPGDYEGRYVLSFIVAHVCTVQNNLSVCIQIVFELHFYYN